MIAAQEGCLLLVGRLSSRLPPKEQLTALTPAAPSSDATFFEVRHLLGPKDSTEEKSSAGPGLSPTALRKDPPKDLAALLGHSARGESLCC